MDETTIRRVERDILDTEHRRYKLLGLPEDVAVTRLLKIAGDLKRQNAKDPSPQAHLYGHSLTRALSHSLRWALTECPIGNAKQLTDGAVEEDFAHELLNWGIRYSQLATDHVAWSNALIGASVDSSARSITFEAANRMDLDYFTQQMEADAEWWQATLIAGFPIEAFTEIFNAWQRHASMTEQGLEFSPDFIRNRREYPEMHEWVRARMFPELADTSSLGEYSIGDIRQFFSGLFTTCECVRTLEDEVDRRVGVPNRMGTWVFQSKRDVMVRWLQQATGLSNATVRSILPDMTFNPKRFHASIAATPFVVSRSNFLSVLPRLVAMLDPQGSVASALTSGTGRKAYDAISTELEYECVKRIAAAIRSYGLRVVVTPRLRTSRNDILCPDLIITDHSTDDVIVADFKNALAATGVAEVTNRLKVYRDGVMQVTGYLDAISADRQILSSCCDRLSDKTRVHGLLVFRIPMPIPIPGDRRVKADNWFTVNQRLSKTVEAVASSVLPVSCTGMRHSEWSHEFESIAVGNWTYKRALLVS